jgi:hypothetical protein
MLFGHEEYLLSALLHGAEGAVGATFNFDFLMPVYRELFQIGTFATPPSQETISHVRFIFIIHCVPEPSISIRRNIPDPMNRFREWTRRLGLTMPSWCSSSMDLFQVLRQL